MTYLTTHSLRNIPHSHARTHVIVAMARAFDTKVDYYKVLEVTGTASANEIKRAYRRLALKTHPDTNRTPGAAEEFKKVSNDKTKNHGIVVVGSS